MNDFINGKEYAKFAIERLNSLRSEQGIEIQEDITLSYGFLEVLLARAYECGFESNFVFEEPTTLK